MQARDLVNEASDLFTPPMVFRCLMNLLENPTDNRNEIAEIISYDPSLTVRLLRAANNVVYASKQTIDNVYDAVAVVNEDDLRTLIATTAAFETFRHVDTCLVDMNDFWNHSICCGLAAYVLADRCGRANRNQVFVAGIIHDIGQLVIYSAIPELASKVLEMAGEPEEYRYHAEKEIIGFTHAEVGAELLKNWGLPQHLIEVVRYHHEPDRAPGYSVDAALVHIATGITNRIEPSWKMDLTHRESLAHIVPQAWTLTGLSAEEIYPTLESINIESMGVMVMIDPESMLIF